MKLTEQERVIRQLVRAAKKAMHLLDWSIGHPGSPDNDLWNALYLAVKRAEGKVPQRSRQLKVAQQKFAAYERRRRKDSQEAK